MRFDSAFHKNQCGQRAWLNNHALPAFHDMPEIEDVVIRMANMIDSGMSKGTTCCFAEPDCGGDASRTR